MVAGDLTTMLTTWFVPNLPAAALLVSVLTCLVRVMPSQFLCVLAAATRVVVSAVAIYRVVDATSMAISPGRSQSHHEQQHDHKH
jgi:hypothetical protein